MQPSKDVVQTIGFLALYQRLVAEESTLPCVCAALLCWHLLESP
jgi:hypothetical protein